MIPLDIKTTTGRSTSREVIDLVRKDRLTASFLQERFRRRRLLWTTKQDLPKDGIRFLKSLYCILQYSVFFSCDGKVGVFLRPSKERDGSEKITRGCTVLKSWSPPNLDPSSIRSELSRKVELRAGRELPIESRGLAFIDMADFSAPIAPFYLFLLHEIAVDDAGRINTKKHYNQRKGTELFNGWYDVASYNERICCFDGTIYDDAKGENAPICLSGAIDRMLMCSLKLKSKDKFVDTSKGESEYFPSHKLGVDVPLNPFCKVDTSVDEPSEAFLRIIGAIKEREPAAVSLHDVIVAQPTVCGFGIDLMKLMPWIKNNFRL